MLPPITVEATPAEDEEPLYNPLNIPLGDVYCITYICNIPLITLYYITLNTRYTGWDGKPIPYWMYKLHGLGVEYKCEVCGNQSYWGRRAFDRHFQEWRHAHGKSLTSLPLIHYTTTYTSNYQLNSNYTPTIYIHRYALSRRAQHQALPRHHPHRYDGGIVYIRHNYDFLFIHILVHSFVYTIHTIYLT